MPYLPDEQSTEQLLRNLTVDLFAELSNAEVKVMGWAQYRDFDHAQTCIATELAADAFIYLGFDRQEGWRRNPGLIRAILAFMERYYQGAQPGRQELLELKQLIEANPS